MMPVKFKNSTQKSPKTLKKPKATKFKLEMFATVETPDKNLYETIHMNHPLLAILKRGNPSACEWADWKAQFAIQDENTQREIGSYVAGETKVWGNQYSGGSMSNSFPNLEIRYDAASFELQKKTVDYTEYLIEQPIAYERVTTMFEEIDLMSKVLIPKQAETFLTDLEDAIRIHKLRLQSYTGLCFQRDIVKSYQSIGRDEQIEFMNKKIENLKGKKKFYDANIISAPDEQTKKLSIGCASTVQVNLEKCVEDLTELKNLNAVMSQDREEEFATQMIESDDDGDDDEDDEENQKKSDAMLKLKTEMRREFESRSINKKRKAEKQGGGSAKRTGFWSMLGF